MTDTATRLKALMDKQGITCYRVAKGIEVSEPAVHAWVDGRCEPKLKNLKKLAKFFNVPLEYFIE